MAKTAGRPRRPPRLWITEVVPWCGPNHSDHDWHFRRTLEHTELSALGPSQVHYYDCDKCPASYSVTVRLPLPKPSLA